jgi:hypothetical protein
MDALKAAFASRKIPGPPCSMGLLLANVTPEDRASIEEALDMIRKHRAERGSRSNLAPNAAWLRRLIQRTMDIDLPSEVIQRHMRDDCRCRRESR